MQNIRFTIEYDGTDFVGWQFQTNGRSVQEELEKALSTLTREEVRVIGAGRTDAGVHAHGQVANAKLTTMLSVSEIRRGVNALLPDSIVVHAVEVVGDDFHARYSARARSYRYVIVQRPSPLERGRGWYVGYRLNLEQMRQCAGMVHGEHDFQAFCKVTPGLSHHRCTVVQSVWTQEENRLYYDITANRFLHGMVRTLVGSMVDVGRGYRSAQDFESIIMGHTRSLAGMAAPAHGLYLERVEYEVE